MTGILKVDTLQDSGGNTILSSNGSGGFSNNLPAGKTSSFRNLIINGDMSLAQRGTSASSLTVGGYRTVDRFLFGLATAGTWTMTQDTDVPSGQGFANSAKMSCTTANGSLSAGSFVTFQQRFEGRNLQYLKKGTANAESVTLSFWIKSNKTGTCVGELSDKDNTRGISKSFTIDSANTWEKKTITYEGDTTGTLDNDNNGSLWLIMWLTAGTDYTSGTLATSWESTVNANRAVGANINFADSISNYINITAIQLEVGTTASDFEFLPVDVNLNRCLRYFQRLYGTSGNASGLSGFYNSSTSANFVNIYRVEMRSGPTASFVGTIGNLNIYDSSGTNRAVTNFATDGSPDKEKITFQLDVASGGTQFRPCRVFESSTTGFISLNAEL